jgi:hypothetical protein
MRIKEVVMENFWRKYTRNFDLVVCISDDLKPDAF